MNPHHHSTTLWPLTVKLLKKERALHIDFNDGSLFKLSAEYLRVESPSAEVQGHGASQKQVVSGRKSVSITQVEPVGNYAVRIHFDDSHNTGIYSWSYLYELGSKENEKWSRYLKMLEGLGLTR